MEAVEQEVPEEGELVLATAREITPHGVYVTLDEYGAVRGFLHISEISTGWVRHIERYVKPGQKTVLKVIRTSRTRKEVDLSLRQVTGEERREKLIEVKQAEKAAVVFDALKSRLNIDDQELSRIKDLILQEFDTLYEGLLEVARKGSKVLQGLSLNEQYTASLEALAKEKVPLPTVEIRGVISATCSLPDGLKVLKNALSSAESVRSSSAAVRITYIAAPRYRISVTAENYKIAEKTLESAIEKIRGIIEKNIGTFSFSREQSRKKGSE